MLGGTGFLDESHAAMHLNTDGRHFDTDVSRPRLDHRRQQLDQPLAFAALSLLGVTLGNIKMRGREIGQCPRGLGRRLHRHQHVTHVRMLDDGYRILPRPIHRAPLHTFPGVRKSLLVSAVRDSDSFETNIEARHVHHGEHAVHTVVFLTNQVSDGTFRIPK